MTKLKSPFTSGLILLLFSFIFGFSNSAWGFEGETEIQSLLKNVGLICAILSIIGISIAGYLSGKTFDSYTGWERYTHGAAQFFNRKPFEKEKPTYGVTADHRRVNWEENINGRLKTFMHLMMPEDGSPPKWTPDMGPEKLPEPYRTFFLENDKKYKLTLELFRSIGEQKKAWPKYADRYAIIDAWSNALGNIFEDYDGHPWDGTTTAMYPAEPQSPPEEWDYRDIHRETPLEFKSPDHAAGLIKKITHLFGASLVGITRLNPDWCYQGQLRGVGEGPWEVPKHWEFAVVFAVPHEWDQFYVNPNYGTSFDAYSNLRIIAGRLENFIHELGYPARHHVPPYYYDIMMPPVAIDAGLGQQARTGLCITPETGGNSRIACVTTNIPMTVNKPVDFGVEDFCKKCKICAETCPTGAIPHGDEPNVVFGYKRWKIKDELCANGWARTAGSKFGRGCRVCLEVCPYSRKNNWIHSLSREIDPRDPTGLVSSALLWMQKSFFKYPKAKDFLPPANKTYHEPPDWLKTEDWFKINKDW
jgi:epoxyqueuosine reductase